MSKDLNNEHDEMLRLLRENNEFLRKINRHNKIGLIVRLVWAALLIGLPFAVYFYFLQPYFEAFGSNYELFRQGMGEIPGFKGFENLFHPSSN